MKEIRKIIEKIVEGIITFSGSITALVVLLVVIFLFKEGNGLFNIPDIEKGYVLCVHSDNPIEKLQPKQIKKIFDSEIENWKELGGTDQKIMLFRFDEIFTLFSEKELEEESSLLPKKLDEIITKNPNIIAFLPEKYAPTNFKKVKKINIPNISIKDFFFGKEWLPTTTPSAQFGALPLILGTLLVSIFAVLIALPLGLGTSIYLAELSSKYTRKLLNPTIELLAGIPSVVYGFFGLVVLSPLVQKVFHLPVGENALVGSLVLAIMALPTIITISEDAIRNTPRSMREASLSLGSTHWQTIYRIIIPYASSGIMASVILGIGRAIGETMAVLMVTGNAAVIPHSLLGPVRTIPATIAAELGETSIGGPHYQSLFMLGCTLFIFTIIINIIAEMLIKRETIKNYRP